MKLCVCVNGTMINVSIKKLEPVDPAHSKVAEAGPIIA